MVVGIITTVDQCGFNHCACGNSLVSGVDIEMTTKSERREAKRKKQREGKLMRGNRSVFTMWLQTLKRNRMWEAGTLDE